MPSLSDVRKEQILALSMEEKVILLLMLESSLELWRAVADDIRAGGVEPWRLENKIKDLKLDIKLVREQLEQLPKEWSNDDTAHCST